MNDELLNMLKFEFGFRDRHILLLKILYTDSVDANNLVKRTDIPKSRIYHFLNDLIRAGLVEKSRNFPASYNAKEFDKNIYKFINIKKQELEIKEMLMKKLALGF